jgi:hypothetical protein
LTGRARRDDDLLRGEGVQLVLDRDERVRVADHPVGVHSGLAEVAKCVIESSLGCGHRMIAVGAEVAESEFSARDDAKFVLTLRSCSGDDRGG